MEPGRRCAWRSDVCGRRRRSWLLDHDLRKHRPAVLDSASHWREIAVVLRYVGVADRTAGVIVGIGVAARSDYRGNHAAIRSAVVLLADFSGGRQIAV